MNKSGVSQHEAIEVEIRDQAIQWFVEARSGAMSDQQWAALKCWLDADQRHDVAWQRLAAMSGQLCGKVSSKMADATLQRASRRRVLKALGVAGLVGALGWRASETRLSHVVFADHRTDTGERRAVVLSDGTQLILNTATAVDVRFDAHSRRIVLLGGEIAITTSADARPLIVAAGPARLRPLGTSFSVRSDGADEDIRLAVTAGSVAASVGGGGERVVDAGYGARITTAGVMDPRRLSAADTAWTSGMIIASRMRLADFIAELGRYRRGLLRIDPAVAELELTGAYPIDDTDRVLAVLKHTLPVSVVYHTPWWVSIGAR
jgi:transmembrane sensor